MSRPAARQAPIHAGNAALLAALCALLGAVLRIVPPWGGVIENGAAVVRDPDACYHLRRAEILARGFPSLELVDPFVNHPRGAVVLWPPLYDLLLAGLGSLFPPPTGIPGPSAVVALFPPLLFAGALIAMGALAWRLWPGRPGFVALAAGIPALLPVTLPYTEVGRLDHHAAELLLTALWILTLTRLADSRGAAPDRRPPRSEALHAARAGLPAAAVLAAATLVQPVAPILVPLAFVLPALAGRERRAACFSALVAVYALAALFVLPWSLAYAAAGAPLGHAHFGLFQPLLLAGAALAASIGRLLATGEAAGRRERTALLLVATAALLALVALLAREVTIGLAFISRDATPWVKTIGESRPLFADGAAAGIRTALRRLSPLVLAAPLAWIALARRARGGDLRGAPLLAGSLLFAVLGILQVRFLPHLALTSGAVVCAAAEPLLGSGKRVARRRALLLGALALLALVPTIPEWGSTEAADQALDEARPLLDALALRNPPEGTGDAARDEAKLGVLAEWSYGHFIQHYGRHPAVADNFGPNAGETAAPREVLLDQGEGTAVSRLESLRVGYVLVREPASGFEGLVPGDADRRRFVAGAERVSRGRGVVEFTPEFTRTLLYRLARLSGAPPMGPNGPEGPPLGRFRLIAESAALDSLPGGGAVPKVLLYEVVRGARLRLAGRRPGEPAALLSSVASPRGRIFPVAALLTADAGGVVEVVVPYPTVGPAGTSRLLRCEIAAGDTTYAAPPISEAAVRSGSVIELGR